MHEPGCGPDATAFMQMTDDVCSFGLWKLGVEQGAAPLLGELLPTGATAEQTETVVPIHLPDDEVIGPSAAKQLAFGIDTGQSGSIGSLHDVLLKNRWSLLGGLQTTRQLLSIPAIIPGHYPLDAAPLFE
jgi:hypothetical protein